MNINAEFVNYVKNSEQEKAKREQAQEMIIMNGIGNIKNDASNGLMIK